MALQLQAEKQNQSGDADQTTAQTADQSSETTEAQTEVKKKAESENSEAIRILKAKAFLIQSMMNKQQKEAADDQTK